MKKLIIIFFIAVAFNATAQNTNNAIEVRLSLLQNTKDGIIDKMLLNVTVINHSNQDVYVPDFWLYNKMRSLHLFTDVVELVAWDNYTIFPQLNYKDSSSSKHLPKEDEGYPYSSEKCNEKQDSIYKAVFNNKFAEPDNERNCLFLKANETLYNYSNWDISFLLKTSCFCKMFYGIGKDDTKQVLNPNAEENFSHSLESYPEFVGGYKKYLPENIVSNTIYYSNRSNKTFFN